jgi:hypothetical protein
VEPRREFVGVRHRRRERDDPRAPSATRSRAIIDRASRRGSGHRPDGLRR